MKEKFWITNVFLGKFWHEQDCLRGTSKEKRNQNSDIQRFAFFKCNSNSKTASLKEFPNPRVKSRKFTEKKKSALRRPPKSISPYFDVPTRCKTWKRLVGITLERISRLILKKQLKALKNFNSLGSYEITQWEQFLTPPEFPSHFNIVLQLQWFWRNKKECVWRQGNMNA